MKFFQPKIHPANILYHRRVTLITALCMLYCNVEEHTHTHQNTSYSFHWNWRLCVQWWKITVYTPKIDWLNLKNEIREWRWWWSSNIKFCSNFVLDTAFFFLFWFLFIYFFPFRFFKNSHSNLGLMIRSKDYFAVLVIVYTSF